MSADPVIEPYRRALSEAHAGLLELEPHEDPAVVHASLRAAASALDIPIVTGWIGAGYEVLAWRRWHEPPAPDLVVHAVGAGLPL